MFMNLAHRGASSYAPENTLAAFYKGIELGANGIETDLQRTKDGVIILLHDPTLDRTTDGSGAPSNYTWSELLALDAGSWFSDKYIGERPVSFEQFLHFLGRKNLMFAFELKEPGLEEDVIRLIDKYGIRNKVTITSFYFEYLEALRRIDSEIRIGHLVGRIDRDIIDKLMSIDGNQICPSAQHLQREDIALAKAYNLEIRAWGVQSEDLMEKALNHGVDGMTVNFPDKLAHRLLSY